MAGTWTSERFPQFEPAIRRLTEQHRELSDEPLHLAISYGPNRNPQDIFLLEVIGTSDADRINPDRELFETVFLPTPRFPLGLDQRLHLILTNPQEFEIARREGWPSAKEIMDAIRAENYQVLFVDPVGQGIFNQIQQTNCPKEGATVG